LIINTLVNICMEYDDDEEEEEEEEKLGIIY
jgi:hypothetical protein